MNKDYFQNPYAPSVAEAKERQDRSLPWVPLASIAVGVTISIAWALYADWRVNGQIERLTLLPVAATVVLWSFGAALFVFRVRWARGLCGVLALLMIGGTVYSLKQGGSIAFYATAAARLVAFGMVLMTTTTMAAPSKVSATRASDTATDVCAAIDAGTD